MSFVFEKIFPKNCNDIYTEMWGILEKTIPERLEELEKDRQTHLSINESVPTTALNKTNEPEVTQSSSLDEENKAEDYCNILSMSDHKKLKFKEKLASLRKKLGLCKTEDIQPDDDIWWNLNLDNIPDLTDDAVVDDWNDLEPLEMGL